MSENPYKSPQIVDDSIDDAAHAFRNKALRSVRVALAILSIPAIYNYICFNFRPQGSFMPPIIVISRFLNLIGLILILVFVWFVGLGLFELITSVCHSIFARDDRLEEWKAALYETLMRSIPFAVGGAMLWGVWVFAFYQAGIDFYAISYPAGVLAHLLAAGLYVPLMYKWFRIRRRPVTTKSSQ